MNLSYNDTSTYNFIYFCNILRMLTNNYFAGESLSKGEFMFINNDINDEYTIGNVPILIKNHRYLQ